MHSDCDSSHDNNLDLLRSPLLLNDHDTPDECRDNIRTLSSEERSENFDPKSTVYTIVSSTLLCFSVFLIGLSFFLPWSRAYLTFTSDSLPNNTRLPLYNDVTVQEIFYELNSFRLRMIVLVFSITTVFAPIMWCSVQAIVISSLHKPNANHDSSFYRNIPRIVKKIHSICSCSNKLISKIIPYAQSVTKFSMLVVYVTMLYQGCISQICFRFGGKFDPNLSHRVNRDILAKAELMTADGMLTYMIGVTCGVLGFINIRFHLRYWCSRCNLDFLQTNTQDITEPSVFSPPAVAFKHCRLEGSTHIENVIQNVEYTSASSKDEDVGSETRQLLSDHNDVTVVPRCENKNDRLSGMIQSSKIAKAFSFETGLLSIVLFMPSIFGPLLKIHRSGILTPLIEENKLIHSSYSFVNIIALLMKNADHGTFSVTILLLFGLNVLLIPAIVWLSSTIAWFLCMMRREKYAKGPITFAKNLMPLANLSVFSIAILISFSSIGIISTYIFDQNQLCLVSKEVSKEPQSTPCLNLSASFEPTMFVFIVQILCTHCFLASMNTN